MNKRIFRYAVQVVLITLAFQLGAQRATDYITYTQRSSRGFTGTQIQKLNRIISNPLYKAHYYVSLKCIPTFSTDGTLMINIPTKNVNIFRISSNDKDGDGVLTIQDPDDLNPNVPNSILNCTTSIPTNLGSNDKDGDGVNAFSDLDDYDPCVPNSSSNCNILIPTNFEYIKFYPKRIEVYSQTEYIYYGELEPCDWKAGYVTIIAKDGKVYGQINYENDVYEIIDLGNSNQVMVNLQQNCIDDSHCNNHTNSIPLLEPIASNRGNKCDTRILVLYLEEAELISDPVAKASLVIQQSNDIARNSKANASFSLAGVVKVDGLSSTTDASDFFENLRTNTTIKNLRNTHQADLVALFTNRKFQNTDSDPFLTNVVGWSGLDHFGEEDNGYFYCNIDKASAAFTFTHELSHDYGCMHDNLSNFFLENIQPPFVKSAQGHSFYAGGFLGLKKRRTIMAKLGSETDNSRIMHLSNPDVKFKDNKTGVKDERNNAEMLSSMSCVISEYRPFIPPFSINIKGPEFWSPNQTIQYCIEVVSCDNPSSITWSYSLNGLHFIPISSSSLCIDILTSNTPRLWIKATAICNGIISTTILNTYNADDPHFNGDCWLGSSQKLLKNDLNFVVFENPTSDNLNIEIIGLYGDKCSFSISDLNGAIIKERSNIELQNGKNLISVKLPDMQSAFYIVSVTKNGISKSKKFIKI
jgi:hypothetical protein